MAAPNVVGVTSIYGRTVGAALGTTTTTNLLTCASNKLLKVNTILVSNVDGSNAATVTVSFHDSSASTSYKIANVINVPARTGNSSKAQTQYSKVTQYLYSRP